MPQAKKKEMCVRKKKTPPLGIWKANTVLWCPLSYKISALRGWNKLWNMHISKAKVNFLAVHFRWGNAKAEAFHLESEIRRGRQKDQLTDASLRKSSAIIYVKRVPNDWFKCHSDTAEQRSEIHSCKYKWILPRWFHNILTYSLHSFAGFLALTFLCSDVKIW